MQLESPAVHVLLLSCPMMPVFSATVCPSSQFQGARTGSCYFLTKSRLSSSFRFEYVTAGTAHKKCLGLNSSLVAIETAAEQEYISEFMVTKRHDDETVRDVLIGLTDISKRINFSRFKLNFG